MADNEQSGIPHVTDAVPINPSPVTPEERLKYTYELLEGVQFPQPMAPDFDPMTARPEQLRQHGLPPRPSADVAPQELARWEKMMTELKGKELVRPSFETIQYDVTSDSQQQKKQYQAQTLTEKNCAGAAILESGSNLVPPDWTVPSLDTERGEHDTWYSAAYVGLHGHYLESSNEVLAEGTDHDYHRSGIGGAYMAYAWFKWYPAYSVKLEGFAVRPGDRIWCDVWGDLPHDKKKGSFWMYNQTAGQYVSLTFAAPIGVWLYDGSTEWIVRGEEPEADRDEDPEANFDAFRFDTWWSQKNFDSTQRPVGSSHMIKDDATVVVKRGVGNSK